MRLGNKYFRGGRYELAIKCYTEAIELCPKDQPIDLATFHQNRAAAHDQMEVGLYIFLCLAYFIKTF